MDTRMIDVAIGLALVFALSSLLASAWQEARAALLNQRGKNLEDAISSLVGDNRELARTLLKEPLLKSLSMTQKDGSQRNPSWIDAETFVSAFLAYLVRNYAIGNTRPASPMELVAHLQVKAVDRAGLVGSLASLLPGAENDWAAYEKRLCAWFDAVGDRSIGWYKRDSQWQLFYAGLALAVALNINPIVIGHALWNDAGLRKNTVAQAELALKAYQAETAASGAGKPSVVVIPSATTAKNVAAAANATAAVAPLSASHAAAMRSVERHLADVLANTQEAATRIETRPLDANAQRFLTAYSRAIELPALIDSERQADEGTAGGMRAAQQSRGALDQRLATLKLTFDDEPAGKAALDLSTALDAERLQRDSARRAAGKASAGRRTCDQADAGARQLCERFEDLNVAHSIGIPIGWGDDAWPPHLLDGEPRRGSAAAAAAASAASAASATGQSTPAFSAGWAVDRVALPLAGWLVTALAMTLGAPFWFDLLGKFVKLRGAGARTDDDAAKAAGTGSGVQSGTLATSAATSPSEGAATEPSNDAMTDAERGLTENEIGRLQRRLQMPSADISARLDLRTRDAIRQWQTDNRISPADGLLTATQINSLLSIHFGSDEDDYFG